MFYASERTMELYNQIYVSTMHMFFLHAVLILYQKAKASKNISICLSNYYEEFFVKN